MRAFWKSKPKSNMQMQSTGANQELTDIYFVTPDKGSRGRRFPFSIDEVEEILLNALTKSPEKWKYDQW